MSRREFSKQIKRDAFLRAKGKCEAESCGARLTLGKFHYDHVIPDGLGGEPTLDNCAVLCTACHGEKTRKRDVPAIAKAKRIEDRQRGTSHDGSPPQAEANDSPRGLAVDRAAARGVAGVGARLRATNLTSDNARY
jgi:hypothetical protein